MSGARRPWPLDSTQRWRLRYWRLWRGPGFDPHDPRQTYSYAFERLSRVERDVFLLCRFETMDYLEIARRLGIRTAAVEWRLVAALYKMDRILDLIDRARGRHKDASPIPDQQGGG
ncbi:MAG: sigma-70 region 4 domain-containing protein [Caulobacteraceae bacterium]